MSRSYVSGPIPHECRVVPGAELLRRLPVQVRETAVQVAKAVLAGTSTWWLAGPVLGLQPAVFAPLAALLVVGVTVQRSLLESARHVTAVLAGAGIAVGIGAELTPWTVALVLLAGLLVARWRWLGDQRLQVPVIALFALAVAEPAHDVIAYAGGLLVSVLLGAVAGLVVNVVIAAPLYRQSAGEAVDALSGEVRDQLRVLAAELREEEMNSRHLAGIPDVLQVQIVRGRDAVRWGEESLRFNPRSVGSSQAVAAYRGALTALSRAAGQVVSVARTLRDADDENAGETAPVPEFRSRYGDLLDHVADTVARYGALDPGIGDTNLQQHLSHGRILHARLAEWLGTQPRQEPNSWRVYGALLVDVQRLLDELSYRSTAAPAAMPA